jgi:hypothetical protein
VDTGSGATLRVVAPPSPEERRGLLLASGVLSAALCVLILAELGDYSPRVVVPVAALVIVIAVLYRRLVAWRSLIGLIVLVILFIPIRIYTLPSSLPFHLDPYRLVVALVCLAWMSSLLIDRRIRLYSTPVDAPLLLFGVAAIASLFANRGRFASVEPDVVKTLLFFLSFFLVVYLVASVIRTQRDLDLVVKLLAGGGSIVGLSALVESYTGYNVFNHLQSVLPFLHLQPDALPTVPARGRLRVYASAQQPIALSCALVMLVPLAVYLVIRTGHRRWWVIALLLTLGGLAPISRTGLTMILAIVIVYVWLRPRQMKRLWPTLIPLLAVVHVALPGAIGSFEHSLFPKGGLAKQQSFSVGKGRLATAGPVLRKEFRPDPLLGEGFGTRIVKPDQYVKTPNAPITDDQALGSLAETGVLGAFALAWLFVRFVRRLAKEARRDESPRGWLLIALAASVAGYGVSMFTCDAFAYIQVTFMLFIFIGLGTVALRLAPAARDRESGSRDGRHATPAHARPPAPAHGT